MLSPPVRRLLSPIAFAVTIVFGAGAFAALLLPLLGTAAATVKRVDQAYFPAQSARLALPTMPQRSTVYAANGKVLATLYLDYNRKIVTLDQVAPIARQAVLAVEDHGFYQHGAVDFNSIIRAGLANLQAGTIVQGASTIAMQLAKQTETGDAQTFSRKIAQMRDAIKLEQTYTKDQILEAYLNEAYFGNGVWGIGTAAEWYFDVPASKLTLAQSAMLAGMIQAPVYWDPVRYPHRVIGRRNTVLQRMYDLGWITPTAYTHALATPIKLATGGRGANQPGPQPYWVQFVEQQFLNDPQFGRTYQDRVKALFQGGLKVYTTLQPRLQSYAMNAIRQRMWGPGMPNSALVSIAPSTGAIVAMANGNQSYKHVKFNLAAQAHRTAGSSFKAFTLAAALQAGISPNTVYRWHSPMTIPNCGGGANWTVSNAEGAGAGSATLTVATWDSINDVFAQVINQVGPPNVVTMAHRMGIVSHLIPVCPLTLGASPVTPLEMTSGYSTLANGGVHCQPYAISKVVDSSGKVAFKATPSCHRAIPAWIASQETQILEGVPQRGTGFPTAYLPGYPANAYAGKTGTGENFVDAWYMGYTRYYTTGVWVGYRQREQPMMAVPGYGAGFGGTLAAPIWKAYMAAALKGLPPKAFPVVGAPAAKLATVPNVVGLTQDAAISKLQAAKFGAVVRTGPSTRPAGIVDKQSPGGGSSVPVGTTVTIFVSNGHPPSPKPPTTGTVPGVVGDPQAQAENAVKAAGFVPKTASVATHDPAKQGIVIDQSPAGGTKAPLGSTVTLDVGVYTSPSPSPSTTATAPTKAGVPGNGHRGGASVPGWTLALLVLPAGGAYRLRSRRRRS